jgi:hypothetical protein
MRLCVSLQTEKSFDALNPDVSSATLTQRNSIHAFVSAASAGKEGIVRRFCALVAFLSRYSLEVADS